MPETEVLDPPERQGNSAERRRGSEWALVGTPDLPALTNPKRFRLRTLRHVADELARVYRSMRHGEIDAADGSRYAYVLSTLGKVIEAAEFESRIAALESKSENAKP